MIQVIEDLDKQIKAYQKYQNKYLDTDPEWTYYKGVIDGLRTAAIRLAIMHQFPLAALHTLD